MRRRVEQLEAWAHGLPDARETHGLCEQDEGYEPAGQVEHDERGGEREQVDQIDHLGSVA